MSKPKQETTQKKNMTFIQSFIAGITAGITEVVTTGQALWSLKTRSQQNKPLTFNPRILSTGMTLNALSIAPITALQIGLNQAIQNTFLQGQAPTDKQRTASAFFAGTAAGFIAAPTEMLMTHLKQGESFFKMPKQFVHQYGFRPLATGYVGTAVRDGIFVVSYLAITRILKEKFNAHCDNEHMASLMATLTSGVLGSVFSQPFDTIKTAQQSQNPAQCPGFTETGLELYAKNGVSGFFKGMGWRGTRIVCAVGIIDKVTRTLEKSFTEYNEETVKP